MPDSRVPVVFIHGLWLHSTSWQPWADYFRAAGFDPITPEWPGVPDTVAEARAHPESQAGIGIDQVIDHFAGIVAALPQPPVLVGHSFGGLVVQALLDRGLGRAGIAIDPAPIRGVVRLPVAQLRAGAPGPAEPGQPQARGEPDAEPVPVRLRERAAGGGGRPAARAVDDPQPGQAAVPVRVANTTRRSRPRPRSTPSAATVAPC